MKRTDEVPCYAADGTSLGFRPIEAARKLISTGYVKAVYGRKGHLRAIFMPHEDGTNPIPPSIPGGARYSFIQNLESARCWTLRRMDERDENGVALDMRDDFLRVVTDCLL